MADLRYPATILDQTSDWFRIQAYEYNPKGQGIGISTESSSGLLTSGQGKHKGTVILPIPSNIQDGNSVSYGEDKLNSISAAALGGAGALMDLTLDSTFLKSGSDAFKAAKKEFETLGAENVLNLLKKSLTAEALNVFGGNITVDSLLARENGQILNQNMELLFNGVTLRTFRFSFKMTPRDNTESDNIKYIIRFLKENMAARTGSSNTFLETPRIFDLSYRKGRDKHPFLHSFKPCFLKDMSVNYTGENTYVTYSDGTPISLIMDLTFQEAEPIYANDYDSFATGTKGVGY